MLRSTLIAILGLVPMGLVLALPEMTPIHAQTTTPQTVQVERGGADIYTQPDSNSLVIGTYQAGVVLTPRLRVFNPEGQAWLKIGDHWIPEESVLVLEGDAKPVASTAATPAPSAATQPTAAATRPTPVTIQKPSGTPAATTPATPTPAPAAAAKPPAAKPPPAPPPAAKPAPKPQPKPQAKAGSNTAVLVTKEAKAQINVRTAANTKSDVIHAGNAGDAVQILTRQAGEGGFTWYKVKFPTAKVQGWVRGDFIKLGAK
ncbi:MAG: SH3 domain-containing protein [Thermosynechococcaceae cyanobacterium]